MVNVIRAYASLVGFEMVVKEAFGSELKWSNGFILHKQFSDWRKLQCPCWRKLTLRRKNNNRMAYTL